MSDHAQRREGSAGGEEEWPGEPTVELLLARIDAGCLESLCRLYELCGSRVADVVAPIVPAPAVADAVLQTVFIDVWTQRSSNVRTRGMAWLVASARRHALAAVGGVAPDAGPSFERYLGSLSEVPQRALALSLREGLSPSAVAERLGQDPATVRIWLRDGLEGFRPD